MKTAALFYFSGTGNTELAAKMIRDELIKRQIKVEFIRIEDVLKNHVAVDVDKYDLIGIGSPILGFAMPLIIKRFVRTLPKSNGGKVFIFRTAGGMSAVNNHASKPVMRMLKRRGYDVFYERTFSISSNWMSRYDDEVAVKLYEATRKKAGLMCDALVAGEKRILHTGFFQKILMECVMFLSTAAFRLFGKDIKVSSACTHCGQCIRNCPNCNITEKNGKIKYGLSCMSCMRCVYSCPKNAINFRMLSFTQLPGGYNIQKILAHPITPAENKKRPLPRFFEPYMNDDTF